MTTENDMIKKFVEMTKDFKTRADTLMSDINNGFLNNMQVAIKNYTDMQSTYTSGFNGISENAQKGTYIPISILPILQLIPFTYNMNHLTTRVIFLCFSKRTVDPEHG